MTKKKTKKKKKMLKTKGKKKKTAVIELCIGVFWSRSFVLVFSLFRGENTLLGSGRKHTKPTLFFSSSLPTKYGIPTKILSPLFSPQFLKNY